MHKKGKADRDSHIPLLRVVRSEPSSPNEEGQRTRLIICFKKINPVYTHSVYTQSTQGMLRKRKADGDSHLDLLRVVSSEPRRREPPSTTLEGQREK